MAAYILVFTLRVMIEKMIALEGRDTLSLGTLTWHATDNQTIDLDLGYSDDQRDGLAEYMLQVQIQLIVKFYVTAKR
ncbi:hypothetical protein OK016_17975 [Vibrio chagasii]|nr:hypothetical protein [Vibrio chagasii]